MRSSQVTAEPLDAPAVKPAFVVPDYPMAPSTRPVPSEPIRREPPGSPMTSKPPLEVLEN